MSFVSTRPRHGFESAVAFGKAFGPQTGLNCPDQIHLEAQQDFQPIWATRAHLLEEMGHKDAAIGAYQRSIALTTSNRHRLYLQSRIGNLASQKDS